MLAAGDTLQGRYTIVRFLGGGGMSRVYLAEDNRLRTRQWAVKELRVDPAAPPADVQEMAQQFEQEAMLLAGLHHPNLPAVGDFFQQGGAMFLVMDYVEGETLEQFMVRYPQGVPEGIALAYADQVCAALEYLHNQPQPIIFRDLKPGNIMLMAGGQIKLIDFGIARLFKPTSQTDTLRMGTVGYAPPEQYRGRGQTDARSDVYGLGATLHHLLTGRDPTQEPPFSFPPLRQLAPAVNPTTEAAVMRALAYESGQRWQTIADMRAALAGRSVGPKAMVQMAATGGLPLAAYTAAPAVPQPWSGWQWPALAALLLVMAVAVGVWLGSRGNEPAASLAAVTNTPTATATAVSPRVATATNNELPTATATDKAANTATPRPSATNTAAPTPTATPTPTPSATPLWMAVNVIAYEVQVGSNWAVMLVTADGHGRRFLPGAPGNHRVANFSPDGETIAFRALAGGTWQIYTVRLDGSDLNQLTFAPGSNYEPNWSLDGRRIAFISDRDGNKELYVMAADGTNQVRLTSNSYLEDDPAWSPDGEWIVFESWVAGHSELFKIRPDGSGLFQLTSARTWNATPAWSPDSEWIAFVSYSGGQEHIWVMRPDGSGQRQLTTTGTQNQRPAWSPDSSQIAYTSNASGEMEIWIMQADGSGAHQLTDEGGAYNAAWSRQ
jgi:Tol biopolymer transport system component